MSSASRHVCRYLIRATTRPIAKRRCNIAPKHSLQPSPIRPFSSTIIRKDDEQSRTGRTSRTVEDDKPRLQEGELQTPKVLYTAADLDPEDRAHYETLSKSEQTEYLAIQNHLKAVMEGEDMAQLSDEEAYRVSKEIDRDPASESLRFVEFRDINKINQGYWAEDEEDEFGQVEDDDDEVSDDMITSIAESELEVNREVREYTRIAAWDLPMLLRTY